MASRLPNPEDPHARHASTAAELVRMNEAGRRGVPLLTWRDDGGGLQILELDSAATFLIGRRPEMSVVIGWDSKVSNLHAKLECLGGQWVIGDDGLSTNGTWVNGERIRGTARLRHKDVIRVGTCVLRFHAARVDLQLAPTVSDSALPEFDTTDREVLTELCRAYLLEGLPHAVETKVIAEALHLSEHTIKKRLGDMYKRCGIDRLARGAKRAELVKFVVAHGVVSPRDYDAPSRLG